MLFNSTVFLFCFLPVALALFFGLSAAGRGRLAIGWLVLSSLLFYAWADARFAALLVVSVVANHAIAGAILAAREADARRGWLLLGIAIDLLGLGWFKYAGFALESWQAITAWLGSGSAGAADAPLFAVGLPLAISFFTFVQIAYLVDCHRGGVVRSGLWDYALFVLFFPKLVAGPIVRDSEWGPEVRALPARRFDPRDLALGLTLLSMGLFKKVVLADGIAPHYERIYSAASLGLELTFTEAWTAALGYTLRVYFDFSGYSDMAIGLARCFGIVLPLNFHSPYKAHNIAEFWRRWHVSLTRWLRLYVFLPFSRGWMRRSGPRGDRVALAAAQIVTMGVCGLWHGAGWTFVVWGLVHGALLVLHDLWTRAKRTLGWAGSLPAPLARGAGRVVTLLVVSATFVLFRADDLGSAGRILQAMAAPLTFGANEASLAAGVESWLPLVDPRSLDRPAAVGAAAAGWLLALLSIVSLLPNSQEVLARYRPVLDLRSFVRDPSGAPRFWEWRPGLAWAGGSLCLFLASLYSILVEGYEDFIYRFF